MTPDEAAQRFDALEKMIERELPVFIKSRIAHNAEQVIEQRVRTTGKDFRGNSFKPYSTKPILTSGHTAKGDTVWRKMGGEKTRKRGLEWVTVKHKGKNVHLFKLYGGYAAIRRLEGLQTSHKDFWFTTQMWRGFGVKRIQKQPGQITVTLGGKNQESQDKIDANSEREGVNIVNISDSELKGLAKTLDKEIQKYIDRVGL